MFSSEKINARGLPVAGARPSVGADRLGAVRGEDAPQSAPQTWTALQRDGPDHPGLRCLTALQQIWTTLQCAGPDHLGLWWLNAGQGLLCEGAESAAVGEQGAGKGEEQGKERRGEREQRKKDARPCSPRIAVHWPHGLSSNTMARITSGCDAMRSLLAKRP